MNEYIKHLIETTEKPELKHLREIKDSFRQNSDLISRINSSFNLVMSAFFAVILIIIIRDSVYTFYSIMAYMSFMKALNNDSDINQLEMLRDMVRCVSADVVVLGMKFALIGMTVWHMIAVNHESRLTPIYLNDWFTQYNHPIDDDLYHSVIILKFIIIN